MLADREKLGSPWRLLTHARKSRRSLRTSIDLEANFHAWEETCVPSYCHRNPAAAAVSWMRLAKAIGLADSIGADGPVLDFGSATGELGRLLAPGLPYHFIEQDDAAAGYLTRALPSAIRHTLESAPTGHYGCVFALDSLEHNEDYAELLHAIGRKLRPGGVLVLSGPTENALYRLGRRIAGFSAHYHKTTIREIELAAARHMRRVAVASLPSPISPLFRISGWRWGAAGQS
jgi:SAM-dependent methyltransferase